MIIADQTFPYTKLTLSFHFFIIPSHNDVVAQFQAEAINGSMGGGCCMLPVHGHPMSHMIH